MTRKVCVFTGTRADYGLLRPVMRGIQASASLRLQIVASGSHLAAGFGETWREIVDDGFTIDARVDMPLGSDSAAAITSAVGTELTGLGEALERLLPDVLVVLGDRYEMLAAVVAATLARIPIAHIHGGEATEGVIDDAIRHATTKLSHVHFAAAEPFAARIIQMGEDPERVHVTGSPGIDELLAMPRMNRDELAEELGLELGSRLIVATYHPVTLPGEPPEASIGEVLAGLDAVPDATIVLTRPNAEIGHRVIADAIESWASERRGVRVVESLGRERYTSLVALADVVVGNSSSGLIDAPALGTPTVNVGARQDGRLRTDCVIDCPPSRKQIAQAIRRAFSSEMQELAAVCGSAYGDGAAVPRIIEVLATIELEGILRKRFYALPDGA